VNKNHPHDFLFVSPNQIDSPIKHTGNTSDKKSQFAHNIYGSSINQTQGLYGNTKSLRISVDLVSCYIHKL
jgi:hypothetical protein